MLNLQKHHFKLAFVLASLFLLQACAPAGFETSEHFQKAVLPNPFDNQRVILASKSDSANESTDSAVKDHQIADDDQTAENRAELISQGTLLNVVVDNSCARQLCLNGTGISCSFLKFANERLNEQVFEFAIERSMSKPEFEQFIFNSPIDDACIKGVSRNEKLAIAALPPDVFFPKNGIASTLKQNHLSLIGLDDTATWDQFRANSSSGTFVAVIDTGVDRSHQDLANRVIWQWRADAFGNMQAVTGTQDVSNYHGTFVAGIIAASVAGGPGVGISPETFIMDFKVTQGSSAEVSSAAVANSILTAIQYGAKVINLSLAGRHDPAIEAAISKALEANILIVAAAGNDGLNLDENGIYPARLGNYTGVITVASAGNDGKVNGLDPYSNYSSFYVKIAAPGNCVLAPISRTNTATLYPCTGNNGLSPANNGYYAFSSGTSFSAPMVSGAAALAIAYLTKHKINYNLKTLERILLVNQVADTRPIETSLLDPNNDPVKDKVRDGLFLNLVKIRTQLEGLKTLFDSGLNKTENYTITDFKVTTQSTAKFVNFSVNVFNIPKPSNLAGNSDAKIALFVCEPLDAECLADGYSGDPFYFDRSQYSLSMNLSNFASYPTVYVAVYTIENGRYVIHGVPGTIDVKTLKFSEPKKILGEVNFLSIHNNSLHLKGWACAIGPSATQTDIPEEQREIVGSPEPATITLFAKKINETTFAAVNLSAYGISQAVKADKQPQGNFFRACNSPSINHGFDFSLNRFFLRDYGGAKLIVRASHQRLSQDLEAKDFDSEIEVPVIPVSDPSNFPLRVSIERVQRSGPSFFVKGFVCTTVKVPLVYSLGIETTSPDYIPLLGGIRQYANAASIDVTKSANVTTYRHNPLSYPNDISVSFDKLKPFSEIAHEVYVKGKLFQGATDGRALGDPSGFASIISDNTSLATDHSNCSAGSFRQDFKIDTPDLDQIHPGLLARLNNDIRWDFADKDVDYLNKRLEFANYKIQFSIPFLNENYHFLTSSLLPSWSRLANSPQSVDEFTEKQWKTWDLNQSTKPETIIEQSLGPREFDLGTISYLLYLQPDLGIMPSDVELWFRAKNDASWERANLDFSPLDVVYAAPPRARRVLAISGQHFLAIPGRDIQFKIVTKNKSYIVDSLSIGWY